MAKIIWTYKEAGRLIRLCAWLYIVSVFIVAAIVFIDRRMNAESATIINHEAIIFVLILAIVLQIHYTIADGINSHKNWGRWAGNIMAVIYLIEFPAGTIFGALILLHLNKGWLAKDNLL